MTTAPQGGATKIASEPKKKLTFSEKTPSLRVVDEETPLLRVVDGEPEKPIFEGATDAYNDNDEEVESSQFDCPFSLNVWIRRTLEQEQERKQGQERLTKEKMKAGAARVKSIRSIDPSHGSRINLLR